MTWRNPQGLKCCAFAMALAETEKEKGGGSGLTKGHNAGKSQLDVSVELEI